MKIPKLLRRGVPNDTGRLNPTLQDCLETALSISDFLIDDLLEGLGAVTGQERAGPRVTALGGMHPVAAQQLGNDAPLVRQTFQRHLRHVLFHGGDTSVSTEQVRFDDLRLFDEQQIDATIGLALVERELAHASAEVLPRLNALISSLMGWQSVRPELNPLRPAAFAQALHLVLEQHVSDTAARNALYVPAADLVGLSLRQLYKELVEWLLVHRVEPLDAPSQRQARGATPNTAVGRTLLTLGRLHQLLAGQLGNDEVGGPGQVFQHTVPLAVAALEDLDLVEPMMQRLRARASQAAPAVEGAEKQKLGRLLGLEVVRLMLDQLTRDERLLPEIRQQIGRLEPVLCRLSHADPRFFSERSHPARRLLEAITQRGLACQDSTDEAYRDTLRSVVAVVDGLQEEAVDEQAFAQALQDLQARWADDDARKHQLRGEAARALLHAEQRHLLAARLASDFERRVQDQEVPGFVLDFLRGPWAQAVAECQLDGTLAALDEAPISAVADDLIWSVQPRLTGRDRRRLVKLVPRLLGQLRLGLERIAYPPERSAGFFDALAGLHEQALQRPAEPAVVPDQPGMPQPVAVPEDPTEDAAEDARHEEPAFWMAGREALEAGYVAEETAPAPLQGADPGVADLVIGAWVDLLIPEGWVRAQLTWANPSGTLFMFMSSNGLAHSMTRRTLDRLSSIGALRLVSPGDVVQGALDAVAQAALQNGLDPRVGG